MNSPAWSFRICGFLAAGIGLAASSGHPLGISLMCLMPPLSAIQASRRRAFIVAGAYFTGATWAVIPAARNFFGPNPPLLDALLLWLTGIILLSLPWLAAWSPRRNQLLWRVPLALLVSAVPPLGIIGVASPLTSAGYLFPGTCWLGLLATAILPVAGLLNPKRVIPITMGLTIASNALWTEPRRPDWDAVNTNLGGIAHGDNFPEKQFAAMQWLQARALSSSSKVVIFPESVVPMWTVATEAFWSDTLDRLRVDGKSMLIGVGIPLEGSASASYRNAVLLTGRERGILFQRIPVPIGMWHPFDHTGAPLNLLGPGTLTIDGQRVAILICYEQLLVWPVFECMLKNPTVLVTVANDHWASGTPVPRCQVSVTSAWAHLFTVVRHSAVNR